MLQNRKPRFQEASEMMSAADGDAEVVGASRVGAELRAARSRLGWRLPDVAASLRIRLPYLEAIEDGRLADLPGNAYAMGFLRSYATMLGLDAAEVARRFRAEAHEVNRKPDLSFPAPVPERGVPAGAIVLLGVVIAVGAYAAWYKFSGDARPPAVVVPAVPERLAPLASASNPSPQVASILPPPSAMTEPVPAAPAVTPAPAPNEEPHPVPQGSIPATTPQSTPTQSPPPAAPAPEAQRLVLRTTADAWIQVRERQGPVLLNRVMRAGETWPVPKGQQLVMTTGNAGGTELVVDGVPTGVLGANGAVKRDFALDADALKPDAAKVGAGPRPPQ